MQVDYAPFVDRMISRYEGGYGWDKKDPGGPTKYGITCYDYAEYRGKKMDSMSAWAPLVKAMTLQEAEAIYAKKYARAVHFDDLPPGIDACMMDYGVNSGTSRAIRVARAICSLPTGTSFDVALMDRLGKADTEQFINQMCDERLHFMQGLRTWPTFGKGWGTRVADLRGYSLRLARGYSPNAQTKGPDPTPAPKAIHKHDTSVSTTGGGGAVVAGTSAHLLGAPFWIVLSAIGVAVVAGAAYEFWKAHQAKVANETVVLPNVA